MRSVGASTMPALLGMSPFGDAKLAWEEATGRKKKFFSEAQKAAMATGQELEFPVAQLYAAMADVQLVPWDARGRVARAYWPADWYKPGWSTNGGGTLQNPRYPLLHATPDVIAISEGGDKHLLEIKTTGFEAKDKERVGGCPMSYWAQVQCQLMVTEIDLAEVVCCVLDRKTKGPNRKFVTGVTSYEIQARKDLFPEIYRRVEVFIDAVKRDSWPGGDWGRLL